MRTYTLVKNGDLYEVYENGTKVKSAIFEGIEDFKRELELAGLSGKVEYAPVCPECKQSMEYDMDSEWHCGNEECKVNQVRVKVTPMYATPTPDWHN